MNELTLAILCFFTSSITAVIGLGGGLLLVGIMPIFLPIEIVIPIHGGTQFLSNFSRAAIRPSQIKWKFVLQFFLGGVVGAAIGGPFAGNNPKEILPYLFASFILLVTWLPVKRILNYIPAHYSLLGAIQTAISLYVGAAGPLTAATLQQEKLSHNSYVVSGAAMMSVAHGLKLVSFFLLGFAFSKYLWLIGLLGGCSVLGSLAGTKVRENYSGVEYRWVVKFVLTILALRLLL